MVNDSEDEVIEELFQALLSTYQISLEWTMKSWSFVFDHIYLLYYKCNKLKNLNRGGLYKEKTKKATINPMNKYNQKCFEYAETLALNQERIEKNSERITKVKPFIDKHNFEELNDPSEKDDWKKFDKNNLIISLNVLYAKKWKIYPAYVFKYNSKREEQFILLIIPNGKGWHYISVNKTISIIKSNNIKK